MKKIVTFDIWDTILKRKCHPEEIKLGTCQYILINYKKYINKDYKDIYSILKLRNKIEWELGSKNIAKGFDREYSIIDVFSELNKALFKKKILDFELQTLEFEISREKEMSYVNQEFLKLIKKYEDCDLYCVSDFYMPSKYLKQILKAKGVLKYFKKIYSSADFLLTKKSGNLFKKLKNDLSVNYDSILHVGDNQVSDIEVPSKLGISTYKIKGKNKYINIQDRKINFNSILHIDKKNNLYDIGKSLSIIPYYFVFKILNEESSKGTKKIYYFTREGEFLKKIHEVIKKNNFYSISSCDSDILEVSRMATFSPSLKEFSIQELMNLWRQYSEQSLKSLYLTLNIKINDYLTFFEKYSINIDEVIIEPWENVKIKNLFSDKNFLDKMNCELQEKKKELLKYFNIKKINDDSKELTIVDIGWRGTIQDNLAKIFCSKKINGYYLAILKYFNEQPKNVEKTSIIEDKHFIDIYVGGLITFFEMIFIPNSGSVIDYHNGKANRKILENEYQMISQYIITLQQGMLDGVKLLDEYFWTHPYDVTEIYDFFISKIINIRRKPPKMLTDVYFKLVLNDTFGSGKYVEKKCSLNFVDRLNIKKCVCLMKKESWKEAFLIHNRLRILSILFKIKNKINIK